MGAMCNRIAECFGGKNDSNHHHHPPPPNNHYHRLDQNQNSSVINKNKKTQHVVYSQNQSQQHNKNGSNLKKDNNQDDSNQYQEYLEDSNNQISINGESNDSQQRAMKKIDSTKYLLKHSNLSAILEEDEQHKDSLKLMRRKHSKDANKNPYTEEYDSRQNSILVLQNIEYDQSTPKNEEINNFAPIQREQFGNEISTYLPNFQQLTEQAMENLINIINRDFQVDGYTLEHNQSEGEEAGLYSQVYVKPTDDGKNKYFKIRTEYNLYNCTARDYLKFTTDPEKSKANNPSIDDFIHVCSQNDYHIMYITYKKVLMCSPRDFIYLKYNKQIDSNTYISVQFSIETPSYPLLQGKERGIIVLSGSLISEEVDNNGIKFIRLSNYAESNLKLTIAHKLQKPSTVKEVKKFILNMQDLFLKGGKQ